MKILQKISECISLESSQENACDGVYFSKVANLQYTDCNFTINKLLKRFFFGIILKKSCLKKEF